MLALVCLVGAMCVMPACSDDGGGVITPTSTAPPGPSSASISIAQDGQGLITVSAQPGFNFIITFPVRMTEGAGLGANINYTRLSFSFLGGILEEQEIGANDIIAQLGDNRLEANQSEMANFTFRFNSSIFDTVMLEVGFTDDRGNDHTKRLELQPGDFDIGSRAAVRFRTE
jgi:hypothetical protein